MLSKETCLAFFPSLVTLLACEFNVVHSYSAIAIERLLSLRENGQPRFTPADLNALLQVRQEKIRRCCLRRLLLLCVPE